MLLALVMVLSLAVPAFADEDAHEHDHETEPVSVYAADVPVTTDGEDNGDTNDDPGSEEDTDPTEPPVTARTVNLNANSGSGVPSTVTLTEDGTLPALPSPARTGWHFVGWYTAPVTENFYGDDAGETEDALRAQGKDVNAWYWKWWVDSTGALVCEGETLSEDITTLYAMYQPDTFNVYWHSNGWKNEDMVLLTNYNQQYGSPLTALVVDSGYYSWEGHEFIGWFDSPTGGNQWSFTGPNGGSAQRITGDTHLYAHWTGGSEITQLTLNAKTTSVHPGLTFTVSYTYSPKEANAPVVTWTASDDSVTFLSANGSQATFAVADDLEGKIGMNKHVTVTATAGNGVSASIEITLVHDWNNGTYIKQPTCTEGGQVLYTCKICGATMTRDYPADGHRYVYSVIPPTCVEQGHTHRVCNVCGEYEDYDFTAATGHIMVTTTLTSCSGTVVTGTCSTCGLTEVTGNVDETAHTWQAAPTVDKDPTCATEGSRSIHCTVCGLTKDSETIPADASLHQWSDWEQTKAATATTEGERTRTCTVCQTVQTEIIPATGTTEPDDPQDPENPSKPDDPDVSPKPEDPGTSPKPDDPDVSPKPEDPGTTPAPEEPSENGWKKENGKWYYYENGQKATGLVEENGKSYYLAENGVMQTGWIDLGGGDWYYANGSGELQTNTWKKSNGTWYYLAEDGRMVRNGVFTVKGKDYSFDGSGKMQTGWIRSNISWYYADSSGTLLENAWKKSGGQWYYLKDNGLTARSETLTIGGKDYCFDTNSVMQTGWIDLGDGDWYCANSSGALLQNAWKKSGGQWYYLKADGLMARGETLSIVYKGVETEYRFDDSGVCLNP